MLQTPMDSDSAISKINRPPWASSFSEGSLITILKPKLDFPTLPCPQVCFVDETPRDPVMDPLPSSDILDNALTCGFKTSPDTSSTLSPLQSLIQLISMETLYRFKDDSLPEFKSGLFNSSGAKRKRAVKTPNAAAIFNILGRLQELNLMLLNVLLCIFDETTSEHGSFVAPFFNSSKFTALLDLFWEHNKGSPILQKWMQNYTLEMVCDTVYGKMESAKPHLRMKSTDVLLDYLKNWDINVIMEPVSEKYTPTWSKLIQVATESRKSVDTNRY